MQIRTAILTGASILALSHGQAALAEITAQDVWTNTEAMVASMGGSLTATLNTTLETTRATAVKAGFALPMGLGTVDVGISLIEMEAQPDGTVIYRYPNGSTFTISADLPSMGQFSGKLTQSSGAFEMLASGTPGDILYQYDVPSYDMALSEVALSGPILQDPDMAQLVGMAYTGNFSVEGNKGQLRVTEGDLVTMALDSGYAGLFYRIDFGSGDNLNGYQQGVTGTTTSRVTAALPAGGTSLMALADALRAGLSVEASSDVGPSSTSQELVINGETLTSSKDETGPVVAGLSLSQDGLLLQSDVAGYSSSTNTVAFPEPMQFGLEGFGLGLRLPLLASETPKDFALLFSLDGLTSNELAWSFIDPEGLLPRDPASAIIDLSGQLSSEIDLVNPAALMALGDAQTLPVDLQSLTLSQLRVDAVGAKIAGSGAFTIDMANLTSFEGFPAPTGQLTVDIDGANGLIETLIQLGMISNEDATGARMGLGMFAAPREGAGDDALTSQMQIDGATGQISVNGMRLR